MSNRCYEWVTSRGECLYVIGHTSYTSCRCTLPVVVAPVVVLHTCSGYWISSHLFCHQNSECGETIDWESGILLYSTDQSLGLYKYTYTKSRMILKSDVEHNVHTPTTGSLHVWYILVVPGNHLCMHMTYDILGVSIMSMMRYKYSWLLTLGGPRLCCTPGMLYAYIPCTCTISPSCVWERHSGSRFEMQGGKRYAYNGRTGRR